MDFENSLLAGFVFTHIAKIIKVTCIEPKHNYYQISTALIIR